MYLVYLTKNNTLNCSNIFSPTINIYIYVIVFHNNLNNICNLNFCVNYELINQQKEAVLTCCLALSVTTDGWEVAV